MSKVKTPVEKKDLSLRLDRRNTYGENQKASRKNIPKGRQRLHQAERRVVKQTLSELDQETTLDETGLIEGKAKTRERIQRLNGFKKKADTPLGEVIAEKIGKRTFRAQSHRD